MRLTVAAAASLVFIGTLSAAEYAAASITQPTDIPAESLGSALETLAHDRNLQLIYATDVVGGRQSEGAIGNLSTGEALKRLLKGTGLSYRFLDEKTVTVQPAAIGYRDPEAGKATGDSGARNSAVVQELRLAQVGPTAAQNASTANNSSQSASVESNSSGRLEEILVTAQKTGVAERLQDVPVPISVVSAQALLQQNQTQLRDYFDQIPGLMVAAGGVSAAFVAIRGITTGGGGNPTVGYTLDDVPLGGSTSAGADGQVPVINPADLAQVEVLRGPQGTLYGDNSMGGLIRYVTVDPSSDHVFGDVRVGSDDVYNGRHLGYNTSAAINLPLADTLAIRVSVFTQLDPGYVDDVETGQRGINDTKSWGGRIAAKWSPSPDFSLKLSTLYQRSDRYGASAVDVPTAGFPQTFGLGDLQQYDFLGTGIYDQDWKITSLTLNANVGGMKLTTISGYSVKDLDIIQDFTYSGYAAAGLGAPLEDTNELHKFSQEVRLTDTLGPHLEWLLGGYYTQEDSFSSQEVSEEDLSGAIVGTRGSIYYAGLPGKFRESAGFGALTLKATDRFDVQFGARESYLSEPSLEQGSYNGGSLLSEPPGPSTYVPPANTYYNANAFTYLISPRFKLSPDVMVYVRVANGFRPGSGVSNPPPESYCVKEDEPCQINPDKITNYEVGIKADFFNHTLSVDSSLYYIEWKDIQVRLAKNGLAYSANGSGAKSEGADLALNWKPLEGLTISTWGAWDDAVLTQPFANGAAGQPLPYSARFSGNFTVQEEVPVTGSARAFFAGKEIYMGDRTGEFTALNAPRTNLPAYAQTDVIAGIKKAPWTFNLYVNNATNRRGVLYGGLNTEDPRAFSYIDPRTIGISLDRKF